MGHLVSSTRLAVFKKGPVMISTYIYPSNLDVEARNIAIAFDEQDLESLVKILKKEGGRCINGI